MASTGYSENKVIMQSVLFENKIEPRVQVIQFSN